MTGRSATVRTLPAANEATIVVIGTLGHNSLIDKLVSEGRLNVDKIRGGWEQYAVEVVERPAAGIRKALVIAGSDRRGTAYGVFSVSEAIGVSRQAVSKWETGVSEPSTSNLLMLAKLFHTTAEELLQEVQ